MIYLHGKIPKYLQDIKASKKHTYNPARNLQIWFHGFIKNLYKVNCFSRVYYNVIPN